MKPKEKTPQLKIKTLNGESFDLNEQNPENFTMLIFYRGLHCPVCKTYLEELNNLSDKFKAKGIDTIAISMNTKKIAQKTAEKWKIDKINIGYGLSENDALKWGLYISEAISDKEPAVFSEPGFYLVKPDNTLYYGSIQTMPFGRPGLEEMLKSLNFILEKDYPARGEK